MEINEQERQNQSQEGTGSAENKGGSREEQLNPLTEIGRKEKKDIAAEAGVGRKHIADLRELGATSGRDDYAGGSGDSMETGSTGERTE
ncbi:MAG TPA: hypothetical protein VFR58_14760 [Flavisolibacter sp.]|nr:hypothetical protein [Flavisolibacter sp.]